MGKSKNNLVIRIRKITLTNFRNIEYAEVDIPSGKISELINGNPSILGIYGQNGSGKTSLLYALKALKAALSGYYLLSSEFASCIKEGCNFARLEFEFSAYNKSGKEFNIFYSFSLTAKSSDTSTGIDTSEIYESLSQVGYGNYVSDDYINQLSSYLRPSFEITDELLQYASKTKNGKSNKQVLIDTSKKACDISGKTFGNKSRYRQLTMKGKKDIDEFLYRNKIEASIKATSFIFAPAVIDALVSASQLAEHKNILESLREYGKYYLFIFMTQETSRTDIIPLACWEQYSDETAFGIVLPLIRFNHCKIDETYYALVEETVRSINIVIPKIVPGLSIEINDIGKALEKNGIEFHLFDFISVRNGVRIPFSYESDGIRRLICFMSLLIAVYNNPSVTVAIDEFDSGIFEYMLGEIISIMKGSAHGQLIFTSHNLRPLEKILQNKDLIFTTINPQNRFSKLVDISGNNNLRDSYLRYVTLDNDRKKAFYDSTDSFEIEKALFEAGLPKEN